MKPMNMPGRKAYRQLTAGALDHIEPKERLGYLAEQRGRKTFNKKSPTRNPQGHSRRGG